MSITIRRAEIKDLPTIVKIYNQAVVDGIATDDDQPITANDRQDWFNQFNDHYPIWVAENFPGNICGWCDLAPFEDHHVYDQSAELSIYIDKDAQRQGIGQAFLKHIDSVIAAGLAFKTIVAYIYERNLPSQKLFAKCGYQHWGQLKNIAYVNNELRSLEIYGKNY